MTAWTYDRSDRLGALVARVRSHQEYLQRDRADRFTDRAAVATIDRRLTALDRRFKCLSLEARRARRQATITA